MDIRDHGGAFGGGSSLLRSFPLVDLTVNTGEVISANDMIEFANVGKIRKSNKLNVYPSSSVMISSNIFSPSLQRVAALDSTHALVAYADGSTAQIMLAVLTTSLSTNIVTTSSPVGITGSSSSNAPHICVLSPTKALVFYQNYSSPYDGRVAVVNITGNTIGTIGTVHAFNGSNSSGDMVAANIDGNSVLLFYRNTNPAGASAQVLTVSGNSINTNTIYNGPAESPVDFTSIAKIDNTRFVVTYRGTSSYMKSMIISVSGTTVSFGTPVVWHATSGGFHTATLVVDSSRIVATSNNAVAVIMTYSGTTLTVTGTQSSIPNAGITSISLPPTLALVSPNTVQFTFALGTGGSGTYAKTFNLNGNSWMGTGSATAQMFVISSESGHTAYLGSGIYMSTISNGFSSPYYLYANCANTKVSGDGIAKTGGTAGQVIKAYTFS